MPSNISTFWRRVRDTGDPDRLGVRLRRGQRVSPAWEAIRRRVLPRPEASSVGTGIGSVETRSDRWDGGSGAYPQSIDMSAMLESLYVCPSTSVKRAPWPCATDIGMWYSSPRSQAIGSPLHMMSTRQFYARAEGACSAAKRVSAGTFSSRTRAWSTVGAAGWVVAMSESRRPPSTGRRTGFDRRRRRR